MAHGLAPASIAWARFATFPANWEDQRTIARLHQTGDPGAGVQGQRCKMGCVIGAAQQATALVRQQQRTVAQAQAGAQRYRLADLCLLPRQAIVQAAPGVAAQAIGERPAWSSSISAPKNVPL
jgi:hypothetical protein